MSMLARVASALRNFVSQSRVERDLDDELRGYVEAVAAEHVRAGMPPAVARRRALLEAGGVERVKDEVRDVRAGAAVDVLRRDVRFAARSLRRTPGFTIAATLALALGIGATTAILSVVNGVLLQPLPYADSDRLVVILHGQGNPVAPANFTDWRRLTRSFTDMAAAEYWSPNLTGTDRPEHVNGLHLSAGMFPMLGVAPMLGRVFTSAEDTPGNDRVAVIGYGLWQRRFAANPGVIGQRVSLDGQPFTIIGVMPASFQFAPFWATRAELWAPLALGARASSRTGNSLRIFARLRPGVTFGQASADVAAVTASLERQFPGTNRQVVVQTLKHKVVGDVQTALLVLLVAVAFVLLIACANVAHMLLARAASRQKELAVRTALGATRGRLVRQLLVESAMLALGGGAAGLLLALWGVRTLVAASPAIIPRVASVRVDGRVLLMTFGITALTAILFGLLPALRAARVDLVESFRDGDRAGSEGRGRHRLRSALVMSEVALALVLLVGAGLMIRSFAALEQVDPGFNPANVLATTISVAGTREADSTTRRAFFDALLARVRGIPGIAGASYINHLPIDGDQWGYGFQIEGRPAAKPGDGPVAVYRVVAPGYFGVMRIPVLRGRDVTAADREGATPVVVINDYMARKHWPGGDALGKRIALDDSTWRTVVGITANTAVQALTDPAVEELFLPYGQSPYPSAPQSRYQYLTLVARMNCAEGSACDPSTLAAPIQNVVRDLDRNVTIASSESMTHAMDQATAEPRFYVVLLGAFAGIALVLAAVGIYGVMSYSVSRRTHEIGIRMALGAEAGSVRRLIVRQGFALAATGASIGLVAALGLTRLMSGLLYGVAPSDLPTFVVVTGVLVGVALLASYLPARRATRIDPLLALRSD